MIIIFLILIFLINYINAKQEALRLYIKNDYIGGRVMGLCFSYVFLILISINSYKNHSLRFDIPIYFFGCVINYIIYTFINNNYIKKYNKEFNNDKKSFALKYKIKYSEDIGENCK